MSSASRTWGGGQRGCGMDGRQAVCRWSSAGGTSFTARRMSSLRSCDGGAAPCHSAPRRDVSGTSSAAERSTQTAPACQQRGTGTSHVTSQRASRGASRGASREQGLRLPARAQRRDQSNAVAQLGRLALAAPRALSRSSTAGGPRVLLERVRRRRGWRPHRGHRARLCDGPGAEAAPRDDDARLSAWTRAGG